MVVALMGLCTGCAIVYKDTYLTKDGKEEIMEFGLFGVPQNPGVDGRGLLPLYRRATTISEKE